MILIDNITIHLTLVLFVWEGWWRERGGHEKKKIGLMKMIITEQRA